MNLTPVTTPKLAKSLFPDLVWDLPSKEKIIYLTFDDGPTPIITDWTLDVLKKYNAKATFFCIGNNIENYPTIFKRILTESHSIGNHTNNHLKGWKTSVEEYLKNVDEAQQIINSHIQKSEISPDIYQDQNLFRPPYGQIKPKQAKQLAKLEYKIIMWKVLSIDWDTSVSKEKCLENVIKNTSSGDIVVFHDSIKAANNLQYTLPKVLEYFTDKGFEFKRILG